jgi:hypothetical protein
MATNLKVSGDRPAHPGLDQPWLQGLGLKYVERWARRVWNDWNAHDPGTTILELLCYAITDLTQRANLPVEDLIAAGADEGDDPAHHLFTAREILPCRPLTSSDYRKLLIDLDGVENAWLRPAVAILGMNVAEGRLVVEPAEGPGIRPVPLRGLYNVVLQFAEDIRSEEAKQDVIRRARERLHANRNLCDDFLDVTAVATQEFILCGELELEPDADVVGVHAEVLYRVDRCIAPLVRNRTLDEMLAARKADGGRYTVDEIFEGPALDTGHIVDEELSRADRRESIRLSDVIAVITGIDGVRAVRNMIVNPAGIEEPLANRWIVPVDPEKHPALKPEGCRIVSYKRGMPVTPAFDGVRARYAALVASERAWLEGEHKDDIPVPVGKDRRPGTWYSIQNHFPAIYGLSEYGLDSTADEARSAQAYQLKAYLLFFDQLMADYYEQLRSVRDLFSTDPDLRQTYFWQRVETFASEEMIYADDASETLAREIEDTATFNTRRNVFLDHLVARFAETFHDYAHVMLSRFGATPDALIRAKCEFLRSCATIGAERSLGYNRQLKGPKDLWNTENVSGLERRLAALLDIRNPSRRNLSEVAYDVYAEMDTTPDDEFRFRVRHRVTGKILLSSSTTYATRAAARDEMRRALQRAQVAAGYQRKVSADGTFYFNIVDETGEVLARRIEYFATEVRREAAIQDALEYFRENYSDEGMYVIENILLRPEQSEDTLLRVCVDPNCRGCADDDPYSYRLHVILPAYAGRFAEMDFRRFVEETVRQEVPAHVVPKICWISRDDMAGLEKPYRDWLAARAGGSAENRRASLQALIGALESSKSVYPTQRLGRCEGAEGESMFILGQTAIGSAEDINGGHGHE